MPMEAMTGTKPWVERSFTTVVSTDSTSPTCPRSSGPSSLRATNTLPSFPLIPTAAPPAAVFDHHGLGFPRIHVAQRLREGRAQIDCRTSLDRHGPVPQVRVPAFPRCRAPPRAGVGDPVTSLMSGSPHLP